MAETLAARVRPLVASIGASRTATFCSAASFELGSVLLPALLVLTIHGTPATLGVVEAVAIGLGGIGRLGGGALVPRARRRAVDVAGYGGAAACTAALGAAASVGQVAVLRGGAWLAAGVRTPTTPASIVEEAEPHRLGHATGLDRGAEYLGAAAGVVLAVALLALLDVRAALALALVPGAIAVVAALRTGPGEVEDEPPIVPRLRAVAGELRHGPLGLTLAAVAALEAANISFTLLILRATKLLEEGRAVDDAVLVAVALFLGYRLAATAAAFGGGRFIDATGAPHALAAASLALLAAYVLFAGTGGGIGVLALAFVLAGIGLGLAETGEHVAVGRVAAPPARAAAFGVVTAVQSAGRLFASVAAGVLWTAVAPAAGLLVTAPLLILCPLVLVLAEHRRQAA